MLVTLILPVFGGYWVGSKQIGTDDGAQIFIDGKLTPAARHYVLDTGGSICLVPGARGKEEGYLRRHADRIAPFNPALIAVGGRLFNIAGDALRPGPHRKVTLRYEGQFRFYEFKDASDRTISVRW